MDRQLFALCRTSVLVSLALIPGHAAAQAQTNGSQTAVPGNTDSGEIVVTAQKRLETASRVGLSITALGGDALTRLRVVDATDLVKQVPGFTATKSNSGIPIYNLRGVGFNTPNLSSTSPVGFYVDEIAYAFPYEASGPIFDIARVEVLKGPQGTLYGRNTTGGLVNFITARPTDTPQGSIQFDVGNYQSLGVEGFMSGPLSSTLKARLAFKTDNSNKGWQKSVTRDDRLGKADRKALRGELQWDPVPEFSALLTANYWRDHSDTQAPQAAYFVPESAPFGQSPSALAPDLLTHGASNSQADWTPSSYQPASATSSPRRPYQKDSDFFSIALEARYHINSNLSLISLTSYNHLRRADGQNEDGTQFEIISNDLFGKIRSFSQELRLAGEGPKLNWIVGGYYSRDHVDENQLVYLNDFSTINLLRFVGGSLGDPRYTPQQIAEGFRVNDQVAQIRERSLSAFANAQYKITNTIKLTAGVRYTSDHSRNAGCAADAEGNTLPVWNTAVALLAGLYPGYNVQPGQCMTFASDFSGPAGLVHQPLDEHNVSWRGAVDWTPSATMLVYGSVSRGYKSGAFPVIPANSAIQFVPAKQEKVTSYEIGSKFRAGKARFTIAGFYNDYRDKQVFGAISDPIFGTLGRLVNVPKSETYGVEASFDWAATHQLDLHAAGSYLRTKVLRYIGYNPLAVLTNFAGDEFPNSPRVQLSAQATYTFPLGNNLKLAPSLDATYQSRSHGDFEDASQYAVFGPAGSTTRPVVDERLFNIPGYALLNGSLALTSPGGRWTATLWARNLLNKNYWTSAQYSEDLIIRFAGMPRTYGASVKFDF